MITLCLGFEIYDTKFPYRFGSRLWKESRRIAKPDSEASSMIVFGAARKANHFQISKYSPIILN